MQPSHLQPHLRCCCCCGSRRCCCGRWCCVGGCCAASRPLAGGSVDVHGTGSRAGEIGSRHACGDLDAAARGAQCGRRLSSCWVYDIDENDVGRASRDVDSSQGSY